MATRKPVIHGRDHLPSGADPVFPALPSGKVDEVILATIPGAYYKVPETSGPWRDSSPAGRDAAYHDPAGISGALSPTRGVPSGLDEGDGALCVTVNGPEPTAALTDTYIGACTDSFFDFDGVSPFTVSARVRPAVIWDTSHGFSMGVCGNGPAAHWGLFVLSGVSDPATGGSGVGTPGKPAFIRTNAAASAAGAEPLLAGQWVRMTGVYDGATLGLWLDDVQVAGVPDTTSLASGANIFEFGAAFIGEGTGGNYAPFQGDLDSIAVWDRALTPDEIQSIADGDTAASGDGGGGEVLTSDGSGGMSWEQPTVEVSGGGLDDTTPDDTPVDSDSGPFAGTPTTGTGWHLEAHTEIVFLVDSTRGRFDVPSMKWTRVPFNTIRILRTWEPEVDADVVKTAWLPDDRGLSGAAKDGVLHVNADMVWSGEQLVQGWVSIEYPVLNPFGLPDDDPEIPGFGPRPEAPTSGLAAEDSYMRALRPFNLSAGSPLHMPSSGDPAFITWHFWDEAHVMEPGGYPPPTYPVWPARPLHLPQPYPQLSPTDSRGYYTDSVGDPGWRFDKLSVATTLSAGANLCLQAWQDSPWLIRFSTDRFPAFHGYTGTYRGYPYLYISFAYDPDTIDHTTGKLLLPAP